MSNNFIAWLIYAALMVNGYAAKVSPIVETDVCITSKCTTITAEECKPNQYWVPKNKNVCCSRCLVCDEKFCSTKSIKCLPIEPSDCEKGYRYHPKDANTCNCCPYCEKCDPTLCSRVLCKKPTCKWNEVYVTGDGICNCCGSCKKVECDPKRCYAIRCMGIRMESCQDDQIYVNPKGLCSCCGGVCKKANSIKEAEQVEM